MSDALYNVSQKNVTNLILNNFNKIEPISTIFAHNISRIIATNHYILLLNLLWTHQPLAYFIERHTELFIFLVNVLSGSVAT